jgi:hypothetical protein
LSAPCPHSRCCRLYGAAIFTTHSPPLTRLDDPHHFRLLGDRAAPPIYIRAKHPERSLTEPGANEVRFAKARIGLFHARNQRLWAASGPSRATAAM